MTETEPIGLSSVVSADERLRLPLVARDEAEPAPVSLGGAAALLTAGIFSGITLSRPQAAASLLGYLAYLWAIY